MKMTSGNATVTMATAMASEIRARRRGTSQLSAGDAASREEAGVDREPVTPFPFTASCSSGVRRRVDEYRAPVT